MKGLHQKQHNSNHQSIKRGLSFSNDYILKLYLNEDMIMFFRNLRERFFKLLRTQL